MNFPETAHQGTGAVPIPLRTLKEGPLQTPGVPVPITIERCTGWKGAKNERSPAKITGAVKNTGAADKPPGGPITGTKTAAFTKNMISGNTNTGTGNGKDTAGTGIAGEDTTAPIIPIHTVFTNIITTIPGMAMLSGVLPAGPGSLSTTITGTTASTAISSGTSGASVMYWWICLTESFLNGYRLDTSRFISTVTCISGLAIYSSK